MGVDSNQYEKQYLHVDVLIVGAGPAGLSAATTVVKSGAKTLLIDEHAHLGGSLLDNQVSINGLSGQQWAAQKIDELNAYENVTCLPE